MRVLVTGGTGTLGKPLVRRLLDDGYEVRVLSRRPAPGEAKYEASRGDLLKGTGLDDAVRDVDVIVHSATTPKGDVRAATALLTAAAKAGVRHLVYVSIVGIDDFPMFYYRTKLEVEKLIETSRVPWTIQRATQFHDLIRRLVTAQRRLPVVFVPSGVPVQPVSVLDVADRLAELVAAGPSGRAPDLGGPAVGRLTDFARAELRARGSRKPVLELGLPGKTVRAYRAGRHLAPRHADGRVTFEEFLAGQVNQ